MKKEKKQQLFISIWDNSFLYPIGLIILVFIGLFGYSVIKESDLIPNYNTILGILIVLVVLESVVISIVIYGERQNYLARKLVRQAKREGKKIIYKMNNFDNQIHLIVETPDPNKNYNLLFGRIVEIATLNSTHKKIISEQIKKIGDKINNTKNKQQDLALALKNL